MDPAQKQYWIFSAFIALVIALLVNFIFFEMVKSSFLYGFPISLQGSEGIGSFLIKIVNTAIFTLFITPGVYFFFQWLIRRQR